MKVLVVDNDRDTADALAMLLKFSKCEVRVAYDGPSALDEAAMFLPDLLLADLAMPGMDGNEVARHVRQTTSLDQTVLAAMTGYGDAGHREAATAAGFTEYLLKPASLEVIYSLLAQVAERVDDSRELVEECRRQAQAGRERARLSRGVAAQG